VQDIPDKGLGFVTERNVTRDNSIVAFIPYSILLNATKICKYAKEKAPKLEETFNTLTMEGKHLSERDIFIIFLLYERLASGGGGGETSSLWKPYIDILPRTLHTPLFYDQTLRACLEGTNLKPAVDAKYNKLKKEYESLRSLFNKWSDRNDGHDVVTFEHFRWADGVLWSRVLSFGSRFQTIDSSIGEDLDDFHLVPFLDFANHSLTPYARWEIGTEGVQLILTKSDSPEPITPDTEICISYGDKPNSELLFVHGFTLSDNPWSAISFPVPFYDDDDEMAKAKLLFMQYHNIKHLVSLTRKKGSAELSRDSTRAMWICVLTEEDGIKFKMNPQDPSHPIDLFIGNQIIPTLDILDNVINSMDLLPVIEFRVIESVLENVEYLLSHLKQTNEQVLKMMEHGRTRELEYIRIYREDEFKFLEFAVEDFTRKRDALMADDVVQRFMLNEQ